MATHGLTALRVDRAHRKGDPIKLCDGGGLYFRKQTADSAAWTLRYRFAGRDVELTLGNFPDMPLADARAEARKARVLLDKGQDPRAVKRAAVNEARGRGTFRELAEDWYRVEILGRKLKHPEVPRRHLDKYLLAEFGSSAAADVHAADIARVLNKVKDLGFPTAANDLLRFTSRIFAFGVRRRVVTGNPASAFTPRLDAGGTERPRQRALTGDELAALFEAIRKTSTFGGDNLLAVKLLLALCVRKGELLGARWTEIDLEGETTAGPVWHLPALRTKTAEARDIPLVPDVVEWLSALKVLAAGSEYVFPQRRRDHRQRVPHVGLDTLNVALTRVKHGLTPFTLHDLRRTARTHLAALGIRREVAERCLGHKIRGVEGTYDTHDYYDERCSALEQWAAVLCDAERGEGKVTPIRGKIAKSK
jgi:integrase